MAKGTSPIKAVNKYTFAYSKVSSNLPVLSLSLRNKPIKKSDFEKSVKDESKQDIIIEAYASIGLFEADEWKTTIQLLHRLVCELGRKIKGEFLK